MPVVAVDTTQGGLGAPASFAVAITKSDTDELANISRAIYVGTGGDLAVKMQGSSTVVTFVAVPAGALLPIRVRQVMAATTASNIVNLY